VGLVLKATKLNTSTRIKTLIDKVFTGSATPAEFDELILYLQKQLRLTVVMITHDLDSIFRTCNRVGVIVDRHMEVDTLDGIVQNPNPWIQSYFHGDRGNARLQERAAARVEHHGT